MRSSGDGISRRTLAFLAGGFDQKWKARAFLMALGTVGFFFPFSLLFVVGQLLPPGFGWISSVIIALVALATLLSDFRSASVGVALGRFALITGFFFLIELVGVTTGFPFGGYTYTGKLGLAVVDVPAAISLAWYSTVINTWRIAERIAGRHGVHQPIVTALLAGLLTLGLDIALEPVAGFIEQYWLWQSDVVPLQNYASWFLFSSAAVYLLARKHRVEPQDVPAATFTVAVFLFGFHFLLFFLTTLVHGHTLAATLSLVLVLIPFALLLPSTLGHSRTPEVEP